MSPSSPHLAPNNQTLQASHSDMISCASRSLAKGENGYQDSVVDGARTTISLPGNAIDKYHPCLGFGYFCADCPGGWFCPPQQLSAQVCPCGMGWVCAECKGGWYCPLLRKGSSAIGEDVRALLPEFQSSES